MKTPFPPLARRIAWMVGTLDLATGLALVGAPAATLDAARLPVPGHEALEFVRFVGAFVCATGLCYLLARPLRVSFAAMLSLTRLSRVAAGTFTLAMVAIGQWSAAWLLVAATDLLLVCVQTILLARYDDR